MLAVIHFFAFRRVSLRDSKFRLSEIRRGLQISGENPELGIDRGHAAQVLVSARVFVNVARWSAGLWSAGSFWPVRLMGGAELPLHGLLPVFVSRCAGEQLLCG